MPLLPPSPAPYRLAALLLAAAAAGCSVPDELPTSPGTPTTPPVDGPVARATPEINLVRLEAPTEADQGTIVSMTVHVFNGGQATAPSGWHGRIYLSHDERIDDGDEILDQFFAPRPLAPGRADAYVRSFKLRRVLTPGVYRVLVQLDLDKRLNERRLDDNVGQAPRPFLVKPPIDDIPQ